MVRAVPPAEGVDPRDARWAPGAAFHPPAGLVERPLPDEPRARRRHEQFGRALALADEHGVRTLLTGFLVFPANGFGSPPLRPAANVVVDPATHPRLVAALGAEGWRPARTRGRGTILPPAIIALEEPGSGAALNLIPIIPGFFSDPQRVFEHAWRRRGRMLVFGRETAITDRLLTMMLSVHDAAGPRANAPRPESETAALIDRYRAVMTNDELEELPALVRRYRAEGVMRRLLGGLGLPASPTRMPSPRYAERRFGATMSTAPGAAPGAPASSAVHVGARLLLRSLETSPGYPGGVARDVLAARRWFTPRAVPESLRLAAFVASAHRARRIRVRRMLAGKGDTVVTAPLPTAGD